MAQTHIFCPTCGSKNDFVNGRRPNFCSGCGYNFQSLAAFGGTEPKKTPARADKGGALDISIGPDTENPESNEEAGISRADIQIEGVAPLHKPKIGDFFANPIPPEAARHEMNHSVKKVNGKKAFESYKSEAGYGGVKRQEIN